MSVISRGTSSTSALLFALMLLFTAVPVALPAMFTMSASVGASMLAKNGVLATRLSAVEVVAPMDVLCVDKTGTVTENRLTVEQVTPLGAASPDEATEDPIDLAVLEGARARETLAGVLPGRVSFVPFDSATKRSEAEVRDGAMVTRVVKGAPRTLAELAHVPWSDLEAHVGRLSEGGAPVLAVASGTGGGPGGSTAAPALPAPPGRTPMDVAVVGGVVDRQGWALAAWATTRYPSMANATCWISSGDPVSTAWEPRIRPPPASASAFTNPSGSPTRLPTGQTSLKSWRCTTTSIPFCTEHSPCPVLIVPRDEGGTSWRRPVKVVLRLSAL